MEKDCYKEIIEEVSKKLADKICTEEKGLAARATMIDQDVKNLLQEIGLKATQNILETTREQVISSKKGEGLTIHKNPTIEFNTIFGKIEIRSPYYWVGGKGFKPLIDEMNITHQGRSETVKRALSDFGIEFSFAEAAKRFSEHYNYDISASAVSRTTKTIAYEAMDYIEKKIATPNPLEKESIKKMLVELDGCEIRTGQMKIKENTEETTPVYNNPKKENEINWRDVRLGFVRPLDSDSKIFVGKMDSYPEIVGDLHNAAKWIGMTAETEAIGVADGGIGLSEELKRQFPNMQFVLDKTHLKDHFYETAEKTGIPANRRTGWVNSQLESISEGKVLEILEELKKKYEENPNDRLQRLIGYVTRFCDSVNYNDYREKGYPIGSGEIESAHKSVPQKRLKISGATWHPNSIDPMLALRVLRADDWWDDFWTQRNQKLLAA